MDRESALTLLAQNHTFPGPFEFRVVVLPESVSSAISAMGAASAEPSVIEEVRQRASRNGRYVALRVRVHVQRAEQVLDIYEVLHALQGVVTTL